MGEGYFNIHVRINNHDIISLNSITESTLRSFYHSKGYNSVPYPAEAHLADRFTILKTTMPFRWLSIFHDELNDIDMFEVLPLRVSEDVQGDVLSFWLYNNEAMLRRYKNGSLIDIYCTDSQAFELTDYPYPVSFPGRVDLWADLLTSPEDAHQLKSLWLRKYENSLELSEELIASVAVLLGIDSALAQMWCDDFNTRNPVSDKQLIGATVLAFRLQ